MGKLCIGIVDLSMAKLYCGINVKIKWNNAYENFKNLHISPRFHQDLTDGNGVIHNSNFSAKHIWTVGTAAEK